MKSNTELSSDASMGTEEHIIDSSLDQEDSRNDVEDLRSPREIELEELLNAQLDKINEL